jgi:glycoprotein endo-alpha-1,2-mannosidase
MRKGKHWAIAGIALVVITLVTGCQEGVSARDRGLSMQTHVFYYPWYGNPTTDGGWSHWNEGGHKPPEDIGANFYPELGLYSSNCREHIAVQMRQLRDAHVGVVSTSWWGKDSPTDRSVRLLLDVAHEHGIKVNFHLEPFQGRKNCKAAPYRDAMIYIIEKYGQHPAFYRDATRGNKPMFYVYDSYLVATKDWATVLARDGANTIRGTPHDAIVIGLYVKEHDDQAMLGGHFDGFYTYFAIDGFTYGSTIANWPMMADFARRHELLFIPSIGPGYDDTRIRAWNAKNRRDRENGAYYDRMWQAAIDVGTEFVSITSFNEWHEGTQIEPAVPKQIPDFTYVDYQPRPPDCYLTRTCHWVEVFKRQ